MRRVRATAFAMGRVRGTLVAAALLCAACSDNNAGPATSANANATTSDAPATTIAAETSTAAETTTTLEPIEPSPGITWEWCGDIGLQCGTLAVLLDPDDPTSSTIDLAVMRRPASDPTRRIGVLAWLEGGPGALGTARLLDNVFTPDLRNRFDIVAWDPRGTGGENRVDCVNEWDPFEDLDGTPETPEEVALIEERWQQLAAVCHEQQGDLLPHLGTYEAAHDLDALRVALGEEQITAIGASYGTRLGAVYATLFPDRVRAMVLDGYDDANTPFDEYTIRQSIAFERELDQLLDVCAAEPECGLNVDGDPGATLDRLLDDLDRNPLPPDDPRSLPVTDSLVDIVIRTSLYSVELRADLLTALGAALDGDGGPIEDMYQAQKESNQLAGITIGPNAAIRCADLAGFWATMTPADNAALRDTIAEVAPRLGTGPYDDPTIDWRGSCWLQPLETSRMPFPIDAAGAPTLVVVGETGDVATPIEAARKAVLDLDSAVLIELESDVHAALAVSMLYQLDEHKCLVHLAEAYLIDLVIPTSPATSCPTG